MRRSQWWGRAVAAVFVYAGTYALSAQWEWDPEPVRLGLVVGLAFVLVELVLSALDAPRSSWKVESVVASGQLGRDAQLASYLRILEGQLTAKTPGPALQNRLAALADRRLMLHHGIRRDDPRGRALLGPELVRDLDGPPRRLSLDEVERHLTRIEGL